MRLPSPFLRLAALACAATLACAAARPQRVTEADLLSEDGWYEVSLGGSHVGWAHRSREPGADRSVVTREDAEMEILRFGERLTVRTSHTYVETRAGEPVSFDSRVAMSSMETRSRGRVEGGKLHVTLETAGGATEVTHDWPEGALFPYGVDRLALRRGLEPGTTWSYRTFSPDLNGMVTERVRVEGPSEVETAQGARELLRITVVTEELMGQETHVWLDERLRQVVVEVPSLDVRMVRTGRARARRAAEPTSDLGLSSFVRVEVPVSDPDRVDRAVYRLRRKSGGWEGVDLEGGPRQRVLRREEGAVVLEVRRGGRPSSEPAGFPAELLRATPYLETGSPDVARALREALGPEGARKEESAGAVARRLARWVSDEVDARALDVGFATAAEVARDRRGDCTEHAVLLAALLRAAGIPSRVRAGLLHVGEGFGYHLWTQAYLPGGWTDLDATLGDGPVDALHIGLATSDLGAESPLLGLAALGPLVGDLEIEVVELEMDRR